MSILDKENIFLLEIMVDRLKLEKQGKIDINLMNAEICVEFQFLDNDPMYVCDEAFTQAKPGQESMPCQGCGNIKNGNSILFSLTSKQIEEAKKKLDLNINVYKMLEERIPDRVSVGTRIASLHELFSQLVEDSDWKGTPCSKALKEPFKFFGPNDEFSGVVCLFVRMSCYGKVIVTSFQMDLLGDSIEYQTTEGNRHYKFNRKHEIKPSVDKTGCCCAGMGVMPKDMLCSLEYGLKNANEIRNYLNQNEGGADGFSNGNGQQNGRNGGQQNYNGKGQQGNEELDGRGGYNNENRGGYNNGNRGGYNNGRGGGNNNGRGGGYNNGRGGGYNNGSRGGYNNGRGGGNNNGRGGGYNNGRGGGYNNGSRGGYNNGSRGGYNNGSRGGYNNGQGGNNNGQGGNNGVYGVNGQVTATEAMKAKQKADALKRKLCHDRKALFSMGGGFIMKNKFDASDPCPCSCPCKYSCASTTAINCCSNK